MNKKAKFSLTSLKSMVAQKTIASIRKYTFY